MQKTIVITDLTQMPTGNRVCVVGIDESNQCTRPVYPDGLGVPKSYLSSGTKLIIRPKAKVSFDFYPVKIEPPHIEDQGFDSASIVGKGLCNGDEWENVLRNSSYAKVGDIYDDLLQDHSWVMQGANTRSIATLSEATIINIQLSESSIKPRLTFTDGVGCQFSRPVSDLTFWDLCYKEVKSNNRTRLEVSRELLNLLQGADRLYLRLGLARPWLQPGLSEERCYLQVTGIYTFPDYLGGKSFADF